MFDEANNMKSLEQAGVIDEINTGKKWERAQSQRVSVSELAAMGWYLWLENIQWIQSLHVFRLLMTRAAANYFFPIIDRAVCIFPPKDQFIVSFPLMSHNGEKMSIPNPKTQHDI